MHLHLSAGTLEKCYQLARTCACLISFVYATMRVTISTAETYHTGPSLWGLWPYGSRSHDSLVDSTMMKYLELSNNAYGIDEAVLRSWETDLVNNGLANLPRDAGQQNFLRGPALDEDGIPKYALTPLNVRWLVKRRTWNGSIIRDRAERVQRIDGICPVSRLVEILGVPPLPANGLLAYCVESKWAFDHMRRIVESGEEIDGLLKAMVLKEMFIF
ncbi:uncharacterized protein MYCFIDRAFT_193769 [Pseudocercospora fijiensis CIRAD86]|uniref:Uncharacterized protein n=1 Tax=Pseudocercospora fijiensis (strain CIRAD86) TaxID=383855 RepID=M3A2S2_PSEFD|nr:uncharacterized protein MYCFIDRAFT_193769 [Pseudocercospora fijiensis CIRAD86]EME85469.1 hypothetical protein MYCFIDRAFT_193769 [Pseudocercospora fijiensis CIRAD86]